MVPGKRTSPLDEKRFIPIIGQKLAPQKNRSEEKMKGVREWESFVKGKRAAIS